MILRGLSDTNSIKLQRKTVQRLSIAIRVGQFTPGTLAPVNVNAVNLKCELRRNGNSHIIFHENMGVLCSESMYFHGNEAIYTTANFIQINTSQQLQALMIDLGGPINLQGDDELFFEASMTSAWLNPASADYGGSTIEFEWREMIGVEKAIPFIKTKVIQAGISRVNESLGDNVTSIGIINGTSGASSSLEANRVFDQTIITSDRWNINDNWDRMISRRVSQFETQAIAQSRGHSWVYRPDTEIDSVQISIGLVAANVITSQNFIVWRTFLADTFTINRSINMEEKHAIRNNKKFFGRKGEKAAEMA